MTLPELKQMCLDQADRSRNDADAVLAYSKAYNQLTQAEAHELAMRPITTRPLSPEELAPPVLVENNLHPPEYITAPPVVSDRIVKRPAITKVR